VISVAEPRTTYRNSTKTVTFVVAGVYGLAMMIAIVALTHPAGGEALKVGVGLLLSVWSIFRLSRCGIYADHDGIRVLNPLSSTHLRWEEIRRFVLNEHGPARIESVHGASVKVFGIQHSPWAALRRSVRTPEARMIDELNRRLQTRVPAGGRG
jgi:hypothetical protein